MTTNLMRRKERCGSSSAAASAVLMEGELGVLTDVKKLIVGDDSKAGGYQLTPDNVVAIWPDQASAASPLSIAWWINRANGAAVKLRLPAGTYNVLNDLTIPANVYLEIDHGAVFSVAGGKTLTLNCEIGVDVQPLFSGSGTVVENYVRRLHINENLISHRRHFWGEGAVLGVSGSMGAAGAVANNEYMRLSYVHSDFFAIEGSVVYTFRAHGPCKAFLVFFDASKQFLTTKEPSLAALQSEEGYTFSSPDGAAFVRITSSVRDQADVLQRSTINDVGFKHLYKLERGSVATSFSLSLRDMQDPVYVETKERPKNNEEAARQLVSCAESYLNKGWVYGQAPARNDTMTTGGPPSAALTDGGGTKQIDCITHMVLALNGIDYFQSKYFNNTLPWRNVKYYTWGKYPNHLYLHGLSMWCYNNGWEIEPGINYSKLQAGDLVFWGTTPYKEGHEEYDKYFREIDHVEMFTGRWVPDPNRNNELHPQTIGTGQASPIVKYNFVDRVAANPLIQSSVENIRMFARIPLETPFTEYDSKLTTDDVVYSSYYKPSVLVYSNGQPLKIDIYGRNAAVWEIGGLSQAAGAEVVMPNRIRSEYVPANSSYKNRAALEAAGFTNVAYFFYTADFQYLGTTQSPTAKYSRMVFKKANNSEITNSDFATFSALTAIQKGYRDTIENGKYPPGFHSYAHLETVIPNGARLDRHNGKYAYTTDGVTWTELPEADQAKLMALRIGDGENNIYIPNGQHVKLTRRWID
ncbi:hypothetical protein [Synergistes jonesii]|uniref:hypothetical protein n=1 Tax=Synergistes jonesii TaxID=2754 RepID=UPI00242A874A|nr:hypothetical protein [Synergistes jonesii]